VLQETMHEILIKQIQVYYGPGMGGVHNGRNSRFSCHAPSMHNTLAAPAVAPVAMLRTA